MHRTYVKVLPASSVPNTDRIRSNRPRSLPAAFGTESLEITPTAKPLADLWSRELVERDPLWARVGQFSTRTVWDLEPHRDRHLALAELGDRPLKFGHAVDRDWLVALQMPGD